MSMNNGRRTTEMIWAISMDPNGSKRPKRVSKNLVGTPAWNIHKMKQVPSPVQEPEQVAPIDDGIPDFPEQPVVEKPKRGRPPKTQA